MADDQKTVQVKQVTSVGDANDKFKQQLDNISVAMSGGGPEMEPRSVTEKSVELVSEIPTVPEIEKKPELSGYIEKIEKATDLAHPIIDDYTNQVLLGSVNPQKVKVNIPLSDPQIQEGLHHKVWEAIRWLAEWCVRQLKITKTKPMDNENYD